MNAGSEKQYRVGIDFTSLDHLSLGNGQYRYVIDLVRGIATHKTDCQVVLFGSKAIPVSELRDIIGAGQPVEYRRVPRFNFRGAYYFDHLRYSLIAKAERLDLWHAVHTFIPAMLACPIVVTEYDLMLELFPEYRATTSTRPYRLYYSLLRQRARAIVCISESTRTDLIRLKRISPERARTVLLGTGLKKTAESSVTDSLYIHHPKFCQHPWIASPYNLEPRKNLLSLLRAFAQVVSKIPRLGLLLFGCASVTEARVAEFSQLVSDLGLADRILLTGYVEDDILLSIYQQCELFVFPSLYEGFGLPVLEAMTQGACIVTRNASSMSEIVGDAGALVDTTDIESFATEMIDLLLDESRRKALSRAAKVRAQSFTIDKMATQTLDIYQEVLCHR